MANKLLLIHDVDHVGRSGEIVSVRPGFARNFLIPQGFAVVADKKALRMQARLQEERQKKAAVEKAEAEAIKARLEGLVIETAVKVDNEGQMYGSVNAQDIQHLIEKETQIHIEKKALHLKHALKEVGEFVIPIKLKEGVHVENFKVKVVAEAHGA